MNLQRVRYTPLATQLAETVIEKLRCTVHLDASMAPGFRFKDTSYVLACLESAWPESSFLTCPVRSVETALQDAAGADYWYDREKKYDIDYAEEVDEVECEYD